MITLKIDTSKANQFTKLLRTSRGKYISIDDRLQNLIDSNLACPNLDIKNYIKANINKLLVSKPRELELIINDFIARGFQSRIYDNVGETLTPFGIELLNVFNYKSFRKSSKAVWFSNQINAKSCIICNTQYTLTTNKTKKTKLLFHLDHYFPKSIYPYLSLSYYNLIPCCSSCNIGKSDAVFKIQENIHPYIDSFHEIAKFKLDKSSLADFLLDPINNEDKLILKTHIRAKYYGDKAYEEKLENYLKKFGINEQYSQFKDIAGETYLKSIYYNQARRKELKDFFKSSSIKMNEELINRFILGNYHQDKDLLKRPLAKLMKDIGEDLKMI